MVSNVARLAGKIRAINQRYSKPQIEMSRAVRLSLMALRVYLLLLVGLIVWKFVLILG
jgi:hypothetical protein